MQANSAFQIISFVASVASLIVAIGAIWLSVVFFQMSNEASKATTEAAKGIAASVERLEKLFDKLYSDTFSMMRETVSDMRKHIWPAEDAEQEKALQEAELKAEKKIQEIKRDVEAGLNKFLERQQHADENTESLRQEMQVLVDRAIRTSRQVEVEAREETDRERVLAVLNLFRRRDLLRGTNSVVTANILAERLKIPPGQLVRELEKLREEGIITLSPLDPDGSIGPETTVYLLRRTLGKPIEAHDTASRRRDS